MATISPEEIKMKIAELQNAILESHPQMPGLLQTIHRVLKADPENVTLLSESDIETIVSGLEKQTGIELTSAVLKSKTGAGGRSLKNTSLADL